MNSNLLQIQYRSALRRYRKLQLRLDKNFKTGAFYGFTKSKQHNLLQRIEKCKSKLEHLTFSMKMAGAGAVLGTGLVLASGGSAYSQVQFENESQINANTDGDQGRPSVDMDGNGDFVVVYENYAGYDSLADVFVRRYDRDGNPLGVDEMVNDSVPERQQFPDVAVDLDGDFVVVWEDDNGLDGDGESIVGQRFNNQGNRVGANFIVNTTATSYQNRPTVAMAENGDFVVAWHSYGQDGDGLGIVCQRYDNAGNMVGGEILVNDTTTNDQSNPDIAIDPDGNYFVVTWDSYLQDGSGTAAMAKVYRWDGNEQTGEVQLNSHTNSNQSTTSAKMLRGGDFIVAWHSYDQDGNQGGIFVNKFDVNGVPVAGEVLVNSITNGEQHEPSLSIDEYGNLVVAWYTPDTQGRGTAYRMLDSELNYLTPEIQANTFQADDQHVPATAMDADGDFVVIWESGSKYGSSQDGDGSAVYGLRATLEGIVPMTSAPFQVNTHSPLNQRDPATDCDDDGDFIVTWSSYKQGSADWDIYGQRMAADGSMLGAEFIINDSTYLNQRHSDVAMDPDGDFVVVWESDSADGDQEGVVAKLFNADGSPKGTEFVISESTGGNQADPAVAMDDDGNFVVTWSDQYLDGDGLAIAARKFSKDGTPLTSEFQVNETTQGDQSSPDVGMDNDGDFVITWVTRYVDGYDEGIVMKRYDLGGNPVSTEVLVNANYTDYSQDNPAIAFDEEGDFTITWEESKYGSIYVNRYTKAGVSIEGDVEILNGSGGPQLNEAPFPLMPMLYASPDIALDADGDFVIAVESFDKYSGPNSEMVHAYRFDSAGVVQSYLGSINENAGVNGASGAVVNMTPDGSFAIAYEQDNEDGDQYGVFAKHFVIPDPLGIAISKTTATVGEDGTLDGYTLALESIPKSDVTVTLNAPFDINLGSGVGVDHVISFAADSTALTPQNISIAAGDDRIIEPDLVSLIGHTVTSGDVSYDEWDIPNVSVTVQDNDVAGISITQTSDTTIVSEDGLTDQLKIVFNTIPYVTSQVTLTPSAEFSFGNGLGGARILSFSPDSSALDTQTVNITLVDDKLIEALYTSLVTPVLSTTDTNYTGLGLTTVPISVVDDDTAGIFTTTILPDSLIEGGFDSVGVSFASIPSNPVSIGISGNEVQGGPWVIPANVSALDTVWYHFNVPDDIKQQGDRVDSLMFAISSPDADHDAYLLDGINFTILDNDSSSITVTQSLDTTIVGESGLQDIVDIQLSTIPLDTVKIGFTSGGEILSGAGATVSSQVVFAPDSSALSMQQIDLSVADDIWLQGDRQDTLQLSVTTLDANYAAINLNEIVGSVLDDDQALVIIAETDASTSVTEGQAGDTYTIALGSIPMDTVKIDLQSAVDVELGSGIGVLHQLIFAPDSSSLTAQVVSVSVDDNIIEDGLRLDSIVHSVSSNDVNYASISDTAINLTIIEDDIAGLSLTESLGTTLVIEDSLSDTLDFVLNTIPLDTVTLDVAIDAELDGGNGAGQTVQIIFLPDSSALNVVEVPLSVVDNAFDEGDRSGLVSVNSVSNDANYNGLTPNVNVSIIDNDSSFVIISESGNETTITEGDTDYYELSLSAIPSDTVFVTITPDGETDIGQGLGNDITVFFLPDSSALEPLTIDIQVADNSQSDGSRNSVLSHVLTSSDAVFSSVTVDDVAMQIIDDDSPGIVIVETAGNTSVAEGGSNDTVWVSLQTVPYESVVLSLNVNGKVSVDVPSITFATDSTVFTPVAVSITAIDNIVQEGGSLDTLFFSVATSDTNYNQITPDTVPISVSDNDVGAILVSNIDGSNTLVEGGINDSLLVVLTTIPLDTVFVDISGLVRSEATPSQLVFLPDSSSLLTQTVELSIEDDIVVLGDFQDSLKFSVNSTDAVYDQTTLTTELVDLIEDDVAIVIVSTTFGSNTLMEGDGNDTLVLSLTTIPLDTVFVDLGGLTRSNVDPTRIAFAPDSTSLLSQFAILSVDDDLTELGDAEDSLSMLVSSNDAIYDQFSLAKQPIEVIEDDVADVLVNMTFGSNSLTEGGIDDSLIVSLSSIPLDTVFVDLSGLVRANANPTQLVFAPDNNALLDQFVVLSVVNDDVVSGDIQDTLDITISSLDGVYNGMLEAQQLIDVIEDDLGDISVVPTASATIVGEDGLVDSLVVALLTIPSDTVFVSIAGLTEVTSSETTLKFAPDASALIAQYFVVSVSDNVTQEGDRVETSTYTVVSNDPTYDSAPLSNRDIQILDDDNAIILGVETINGTLVIEGATGDSLWYALGTIPSDTVEITLSGNTEIDLGNGSGNDFTVTFLPNSTALDTQFVFVSATDDDVLEDTDFVIVSHAISSNDLVYDALSLPDVSIEVIDNETSGVLVVATGGNLLLKENDIPDTLQVSIPSIPSDTVRITIDGHPFIDLGNGPGQSIVLVFPPDSTALNTLELLVYATDDAYDYPDSNVALLFNVSSLDPEYDGISINDEAAFIVDNDISQVQLNEIVQIDEGESGDLEITLTSIPFDTVKVTITPDETMDAGNGYGVPVVVVIPPDSSALVATSVIISVKDSAEGEGSLNYQVTSGDQNYDGFIIPTTNIDIIEATSKIIVELTGNDPDTTFSHTDTIPYVVRLKTIPLNTVTIEIDPDDHLILFINGVEYTDGATIEILPDSTALIGQEIFVVVIPDGLPDGDATCTIDHTARSGDVVYDNETETFNVNVAEVDPLVNPKPVYVYNVVSPNGDGKNDYFHLDHLREWEEVWVTVYGRHGGVVFSSGGRGSNAKPPYSNNIAENRFNGLNEQGEKLVSGMYVYIIRMMQISSGKLRVADRAEGVLFIAD